MNSLKFLYEVFMPEARFPDEKFWNRDGSPIHPEPKGVPRGTVGTTHGDWGANDHPDDPSDDPYLPHELADADMTQIDASEAERDFPGCFDLEEPGERQGDLYYDSNRQRLINKIPGNPNAVNSKPQYNIFDKDACEWHPADD